MSVQENDPEVQKNGFRAIVEAVDLNPKALEGEKGGDAFFADHFDPSATWEENLATFREWIRSVNRVFSNADVEEIEGLIDDDDAND